MPWKHGPYVTPQWTTLLLKRMRTVYGLARFYRAVDVTVSMRRRICVNVMTRSVLASITPKREDRGRSKILPVCWKRVRRQRKVAMLQTSRTRRHWRHAMVTEDSEFRFAGFREDEACSCTKLVEINYVFFCWYMFRGCTHQIVIPKCKSRDRGWGKWCFWKYANCPQCGCPIFTIFAGHVERIWNGQLWKNENNRPAR